MCGLRSDITSLRVTDEPALVASPSTHRVQTLRAGVEATQSASIHQPGFSDTPLSDQPPTTT